MRRKSDNSKKTGRKSISDKSKKGGFAIAHVTPLSTNKTGRMLTRSAGAGDDQGEQLRRRPLLLQARGRAQDFGNF